MIANYHTHTSRCRHATGEDEAYVRAAIDAGLEILGFSDHTPYWFPEGHYSSFRMFREQLPDYVNSILELRRRYADKIQIHLGVETEFYPRFFPETLARLRDTPMEYMILGQHFIGNEHDATYSANQLNTERELARYVDQTAEALATGRFTYFAHPDLVFFAGDEAIYEKHIRRLCENAKALDIPLEINLLGINTNRAYPCNRFFRIAADVGNTVVLGSDAHVPHDVFLPDIIERATAFAHNLGLEPTEDFRIRNPFLR